MSRYLRVQPLKSKYATATAEAFKKMIKIKQPKELWVDKGTEFKGSFQSLCDKKGILTYTTESEKICICREKYSIFEEFDLQIFGAQMDLLLHRQASRICSHN